MKTGKLILLAAAITLFACKKDKKATVTNPPSANTEELITTMRIDFFAPNGDSTAVTFRDPDGAGGNPPVQFDTIRLVSGLTYHAKIHLYNESVFPIIDITPEILEEAHDHLFCFDPQNVAISIVRTDSDGTYGIGLQSDWTTGGNATGTTTVRLRHQPGVKDGTCTPGETDVEVAFVTEVAI